MAALPLQQLHTLLQTLEFGINSTEADAMQSALEALAALAKYDYQSKRKGQPGLSPDAGTSQKQLPCLLVGLQLLFLIHAKGGA